MKKIQGAKPMKILFNALQLFILGIYADTCRKRFDKLLNKSVKTGYDMSSPKLTALSNHIYHTCIKFNNYEMALYNEFDSNFKLS